VQQIYPNSSAAKYGLKANDIILEGACYWQQNKKCKTANYLTPKDNLRTILNCDIIICEQFAIVIKKCFIMTQTITEKINFYFLSDCIRELFHGRYL